MRLSPDHGTYRRFAARTSALITALEALLEEHQPKIWSSAWLLATDRNLADGLRARFSYSAESATSERPFLIDQIDPKWAANFVFGKDKKWIETKIDRCKPQQRQRCIDDTISFLDQHNPESWNPNFVQNNFINLYARITRNFRNEHGLVDWKSFVELLPEKWASRFQVLHFSGRSPRICEITEYQAKDSNRKNGAIKYVDVPDVEVQGDSIEQLKTEEVAAIPEQSISNVNNLEKTPVQPAEEKPPCSNKTLKSTAQIYEGRTPSNIESFIPTKRFVDPASRQILEAMQEKKLIQFRDILARQPYYPNAVYDTFLNLMLKLANDGNDTARLILIEFTTIYASQVSAPNSSPSFKKLLDFSNKIPQFNEKLAETCSYLCPPEVPFFQYFLRIKNRITIAFVHAPTETATLESLWIDAINDDRFYLINFTKD